MNILVIGSGGHENFIIKKLYIHNKNLYCIGITNTNPDIKQYTKHFSIIKNENDFNLKLKLIVNYIILTM